MGTCKCCGSKLDDGLCKHSDTCPDCQKRVQVCFMMDRDLYEEMVKIREEAGMPISQQVNLRLKGYAIKKIPVNKGEVS